MQRKQAHDTPRKNPAHEFAPIRKTRSLDREGWIEYFAASVEHDMMPLSLPLDANDRRVWERGSRLVSYSLYDRATVTQSPDDLPISDATSMAYPSNRSIERDA